jgi:hypothetical protein
MVLYGDSICVAWIDRKGRIVLSLLDPSTGEKSETIIREGLSGAIAISMGRIGRNLMLAWAQGGYYAAENEVKVEIYTLPDDDQQKSTSHRVKRGS